MARMKAIKEGENLVITKHALPGFGHLTPQVTLSISRAGSGRVRSVASSYLVVQRAGLGTALLYGLPTHIYGLSPCEVTSKRRAWAFTYSGLDGTRFARLCSAHTVSFSMRRLLKSTHTAAELRMYIAYRYALRLNASKIWRIGRALAISPVSN